MASFDERVDPELTAGLEVYRLLGFEETDLSGETLATMRATLDAVMAGAAAEAPPNERVATTTHGVAVDGGVEMEVRVHRPVGADGALPALYWMHGGGLVMGNAAMDDLACQAYAEALGAVVVAPDYRLAPEHPFPTPVEDCYAGLRWLVDSADDLGVDPSRVAVGGGSAGGNLAAGTCLLARDRGGPAVAFQLLVYPMLDDRNETASAREFDDIVSWSHAHNAAGWAAYLGDEAGGDDVSPYAAPARADDLSGLPPTLVQVGELEVFRDEDIAYATRLLQAGVPTELHVYPGAFHGWDSFAPEADVTVRTMQDRLAALGRALAG